MGLFGVVGRLLGAWRGGRNGLSRVCTIVEDVDFGVFEAFRSKIGGPTSGSNLY